MKESQIIAIYQNILSTIKKAYLLDCKNIEIFLNNKFGFEELDSYVEEKDTLLNLLDDLENEIGSLVSGEISDGSAMLRKKECLDLVSETNQEAVKLQNKENEIKRYISKFLDSKRNEVKTGRMTSKAAMKYYTTQRNSGFLDPQFLDDKK